VGSLGHVVHSTNTQATLPERCSFASVFATVAPIPCCMMHGPIDIRFITPSPHQFGRSIAHITPRPKKERPIAHGHAPGEDGQGGLGTLPKVTPLGGGWYPPVLGHVQGGFFYVSCRWGWSGATWGARSRSGPTWRMGLVLGPAKACCSMKCCSAAVVLGGDYKSPAPSVCSIERGSNGGLGPFEWAQSGKPRVLGGGTGIAQFK